MKKFKIVKCHKLENIKLFESICREDSNIYRFTATICGYQKWKIYEGKIDKKIFDSIIDKCIFIRDRIKNNDRDIFYDKNEFMR